MLSKAELIIVGCRYRLARIGSGACTRVHCEVRGVVREAICYPCARGEIDGPYAIDDDGEGPTPGNPGKILTRN